MEAHGGRIWAESDSSGLRARFTFTIPAMAELGAPVPTALFRHYERQGVAGKEQRYVLAVDDDPQALRYVREALSKSSYGPIVTGDSEEALALMEANNPHLEMRMKSLG